MKTDSQKHSEYFDNIKSKLKNGKIHEETQDAKVMYLSDACQFGHIDIVKGLILAKVDVNSKSDLDQPLQRAIRSNNQDIVDLLMANGANPNGGHGTLLFYNTHKKDLKVAEKLIELGADVNFQLNPNGPSVLQMAVRNCNLQLVDLLLKKGAKVDVPDYFANIEDTTKGNNANDRKAIDELLKEYKLAEQAHKKALPKQPHKWANSKSINHGVNKTKSMMQAFTIEERGDDYKREKTIKGRLEGSKIGSHREKASSAKNNSSPSR
jgi:hypothetical protein